MAVSKSENLVRETRHVRFPRRGLLRLESPLSVCLTVFLIASTFASEQSLSSARAPRHLVLSDSSLLLPLRIGAPITYELHAEGGCFLWSSLRPEVVSVEPNYVDESKQCAMSATVITKWGRLEPVSTIISVEEIGTGYEIRCEVMLDRIHAVDLVTTSRTMYVGTPPEAIHVSAQNALGNTFSTLDGHEFVWTLSSQSGTPTDTMRIVDFETSSYEARAAILDLEKEGARGHVVLVNPHSSGVVRIHARLNDPSYSDTIACEKVFVVVDNLQLSPNVVYLLPNQTVSFTLSTISFSPRASHPIALPSSQYKFALGNASVCDFDSSSTTVTALVLGETQLVVHDLNINYDTVNRPQSKIFVLEPVGVLITVQPHDPHHLASMSVLELGREYEVRFHPRNADGQPIDPHEGHLFEGSFESGLEVLFSSANFSYHVVRAKTLGPALISATFVKFNDGVRVYVPPISPRGERLVHIYNPITLLPPTVLLALSARDKPFLFPMKVSGGTGKYGWKSQHPDAVGVQSGMVSPLALGSSIIRAYDSANSLHFAESLVKVSNVWRLQFLRSVREVEVGRSLDIPLAVFNEDGEAFSFCNNMPLAFNVADRTIFSLSSNIRYTPSNTHCLFVTVQGLSVGSTNLTATLGPLTASTLIHAYPPFHIVQPVDYALLTFGASYDVIFEGGASSSHALKPVDPQSNLRIMPVGDSLARTYRVVCADIGEHVLELVVYHTEPDEETVSDRATTRIVCDHPRYAVLTLAVPSSHSEVNLSRCATLQGFPSTAHSVLCNSSLTANVELQNKDHLSFHNYSTAHLVWTHDADAKAIEFFRRNHAYSEVGIFIGELEHRTLVTVNVTGYRVEEAFDPALPATPTLPREVTGSLLLRSFKQHFVSPSSLFIANSPSTRGHIRIAQGTGFFSVRLTGEPTVGLSFANRDIAVSPIRLGSTKASVVDDCLRSSVPVIVDIHVSEPLSFRIEMKERVQVLNSTNVCVTLIDVDGNEFPADQYDSLDLVAHHSSDIVSMAEAPHGEMLLSHKYYSTPDPCPNGRYYSIYGSQPGTVLISFSARKHLDASERMVSESRRLEVFRPLVFSPRIVYLLPDAQFQVLHRDGPSGGQITIKYSVDNTSVVTVDAAGLLTAHEVGTTMLHARADGADFYCSQESIPVIVLLLTSIRIHAPSLRILEGNTMNAYVIGLNGETPFTYGTLPFRFMWSSSNLNVLTQRPLYHAPKTSFVEEEDFSINVHALQGGSAVLSVEMILTEGMSKYVAHNASLSYSVQVDVLESLKLLAPSKILIPFGSFYQIKTNLDGVRPLSYSLYDVAVAPNAASGTPVIQVSATGLVTSLQVPGHVTVTIRCSEKSVAQQVSLAIEVAAAHHVSIIPTMTLLPHSTPLGVPLYLPVGLTAKFMIRVHDQTSRTFDCADNIPIEYRLNKFDIVRLKTGHGNNTALITAMTPGNTILQASIIASQGPVSDYLRVRSIAPLNLLRTGACEEGEGDGSEVSEMAVVHVHSPVTFAPYFTVLGTKMVLDGVWASSNPDVFYFESSRKSEGFSNNGGVALLSCTTNAFMTYTQIIVAHVASISVDQERSSVGAITNVRVGHHSGAYIVALIFRDSFGRAFSALPEAYGVEDRASDGAPVYRQSIMFTCRILNAALASFFEVENRFDSQSGQSACVLTPKAHIAHQYVDAATLGLRVTVTDLPRTYSHHEDLIFEYIAGFVLHQQTLTLDGSAAPTFSLASREHHEFTFSIDGQTTYTHARASAPLLKKYDLSVIRIKQLGSPTLTRAEVEFEVLLGEKIEPHHQYTLNVVSTTTGQRAVLSFSYEPGSSFLAYLFQAPYLGYGVAFIIFLIATALLVSDKSSSKPSGHATVIPPATPRVAHAPKSNFERNPRSPLNARL